MIYSIVPGRMTTDSSLASLKQKSISSLISSKSERFSFTCIALLIMSNKKCLYREIYCLKELFCNELTIIAIDPSGLWGQEMHGIFSISLQQISEVCLRMFRVLEKKTSVVCVIMRGTAAYQTRTAINQIQ